MTFDLAFVDSIVATPTYRLNLNGDNPLSVMVEGSSFGMPELRRARAATLLVDGDFISSSAYGNRVITLRVQLADDMANKDAAAIQVQTLAREVNRETNILRYRAGTTDPVFFRTFRSDVASVEWDGVSAFATVVVEAEPFALGLQETPASITLGGDPASGNGIWADLTGVRGDVETPLIVTTPRIFTSQTARQTVFGTRRRAAGFTLSGVQQAESLSVGTDTTTQTVAGYSGGTPNCARVSYTTTANLVRLSGFLTAFPTSAETRSRYRVYARVKKSVAGDPITMQFGWGYTAPATVLNTAVTLPSTTNTVIVDLGDMTIPHGPDPIYLGASGTELQISGGAYAEVYSARASGTSTLEIDFLAFIPASDQVSILSLPSYGAASGPLQIWDGVNEVVYEAASSLGSAVRQSPAVPIEGAASIMVSPGATNRIWSLRNVTPAAATDLVGETYGLAYYPRYLFARPVGT